MVPVAGQCGTIWYPWAECYTIWYQWEECGAICHYQVASCLANKLGERAGIVQSVEHPADPTL